MKIDIETLRKTKGIGQKTLERIVKQHYIDNEIKSFKSEYMPSNTYKMDNNINLWRGDCLDLMSHIPDNSVDFVFVDPPYFLHGLEGDWSGVNDQINNTSSKTIKNLPAGMKFDVGSGQRLKDFAFVSGQHYKRVMKRGSLGVVFMQARLSHNLCQGLEEAGLEIRDLLFWKRKSLPKAQNLKRYGIQDDVITPQPLQQIEVMVLFRNPHDSFVEAYNQHGVGMMNFNRSTIYSYAQSGNNYHPTEKPINLLSEIIKQFTNEEMLVLDNTMGSGSTGVACKNLNRKFIGIELDEEYFNIAKDRIHKV